MPTSDTFFAYAICRPTLIHGFGQDVMPAAPSIGSPCHLTGRAAEFDVESCPVSYNRLSSRVAPGPTPLTTPRALRETKGSAATTPTLVNQKMAKIGRMQSWI